MVRIRFLDLQVDSVSNASGIYSGDNRLWGYKHKSKRNVAFGTIDGVDSFVSDIQALLEDDDFTDAAGRKQDKP